MVFVHCLLQIVEGDSDVLIESVANRIARTILERGGNPSSHSSTSSSNSLNAASSALEMVPSPSRASGKATPPIRIDEVRVRVKKPHVAVAGVVDYLGVELVRTRADYPQLSQP